MATFLIGKQKVPMLLSGQDCARLRNLLKNEGGCVYVLKSGYAEYSVGGNKIRHRQLVHRIIAEWAGMDTSRTIDHVRSHKLDNRRSQLRPATRAQQSYNQHGCMRGKVKYRGVHKHHDKFRAMISYGNKSVHIGIYSYAKDAAKAYDKAAKRLRGKFAVLNFPI